MWECAICRTRLWKNSGIHRMIKTRSGNYRVAGLCRDCVGRLDYRHEGRSLWKTLLVFVGIAISAAIASFLLMPKLG